MLLLNVRYLRHCTGSVLIKLGASKYEGAAQERTWTKYQLPLPHAPDPLALIVGLWYRFPSFRRSMHAFVSEQTTACLDGKLGYNIASVVARLS